MQLLITAPYGSLHQETGVLYMLANYLTSQGVSVRQLRCNGLFAACDRDETHHWTRRLDSCQECMGEQVSLSLWSRTVVEEFSSHLTPSAAEESKKMISRTPNHALVDFVWEGVAIFPLIQNLFQARFGVKTPDIGNRHQEQFSRKLLNVSSRMVSLAHVLCEKIGDTVMVSVDGDNFMSSAIRIAAEKKRVPLVLARWDASLRGVQFRNTLNGKQLVTDVVVSSISNIRADCRTWPTEVVSVLEQIRYFLGLEEKDLPQSAAG